MSNQQKTLTQFAIISTLFVWLAAMALSYEGQVEFAIQIGFTGSIFGVSKAYIFPLITDLTIAVSAAWLLVAAMQGLPTWKYRLTMFVFSGATIWFNIHHVDIVTATYTKILAVSWPPIIITITTEMLLSYLEQQAKARPSLESRIEALETCQITQAVATSFLVSPVTGEAKNQNIDEILPSAKPSPLQLANEAKMAKKQQNLETALSLFNEGKTNEQVADLLDVAVQTARNYRAELNGRVKNG